MTPVPPASPAALPERTAFRCPSCESIRDDAHELAGHLVRVHCVSPSAADEQARAARTVDPIRWALLVAAQEVLRRGATWHGAMADFKRALLEVAVVRAEGNVAAAGQALGLAGNSVYQFAYRLGAHLPTARRKRRCV